MKTNDDMGLLREYAATRSDAAFAEIVSRHLNLVYSSALRQVRDPHLAGEVSQAVFVILSQKAGSLGGNTILGGWLHRTTRYVSANVLQKEYRRLQRQMEAHVQTTLQTEHSESVWREMLPLLDEALELLRQKDRDAVVLRYFENRSLQEVAVALGIHERAAQKRVLRSLEKLRVFFLKRGVPVSSAAIASAVSAHSVQSAPITLKLSVVAVVKSSAAAIPATTLLHGAIKTLAAQLKLNLAGGLVLALVLSGAGFTVINTHRSRAQERDPVWMINGSSAAPRKGVAPHYFAHAELFEIYNPGNLDSIQLPVQSLNSGRLDLSLAEDDHGLPGNVLEKISGVTAPKVGDTNALMVQSINRPLLKKGMKYWLCAEPADENAQLVWFYHPDLPRNISAVRQVSENTPWTTQSAARSNLSAALPNNIRKEFAYRARLIVSDP